MKKLYFPAGACFFILFSLIYFLYFTNIESKIETLAVSKIQKWTARYNVQVQWESISIEKLKFKITFNHIQFQLQPSSPPVKLTHLTLKTAPLASILRGRWVFDLQLKGLHYHLKSGGAKHKFQTLDLSQLPRIPIHKIQIINSDLHIQAPHASVPLNEVQINIKNKLNSLEIQWNAGSYTLGRAFNTQSRISIHSDKVQVHSLQIKGEDSNLLLSGQAPFVHKEQAQLNIKGSFSAQDFKAWIQPWKNIKKWSSISGFFTINSQISYSKKQAYKGPFQMEIQDFSWKHITVDKINLGGVFNKKYIELNMAHLEKENQWTAYLDKARFQINKSASFSFKNHIYIKKFHSIEKILQISTGLDFKGPVRSSCKGSFFPASFHCTSVKGSFSSFQLAVKGNEITRLPLLNFNGSLSWAAQKILKGSLSANSQTQIQFQTLLNQNQKTTFYGNIDFSDVEHIYGLKVNGKSHIEQGFMAPSKNFLVKTQLKAQNFILDGFKLGHFKTHLLITRKHLHFTKIKGAFNKSSYQGSFKILLRKKPWITVQSQFQPLYLEDLSSSLDQRFSLPFDASGSGSAAVTVNSALNWPRLSYQLTSQFQDIHVMDEFFQNAVFNIKSVKGRSKIEKASLQKIKGQIQAEGGFNLLKKISVHISGKKLLLERIGFLAPWLRSRLSGLFDFQMHLNGSFRKPKFILKGQINNIYTQNQILGKSQFQLKLSSRQIKGQGLFFNKKLSLDDFLWNYNDKKLSIQLKANDLNFIPLLPFNDPSSSALISSQLTGSVFLHWTNYQAHKTSGHLSIQHISMTHGNHKLQSSHPVNIRLNHGDFTFQNSSIKFMNNDQPLFIKKITPAESLLTGPVQLEFLNLLAPGIKEAKGALQAHFSFKNNLNEWSPKGSLQIQNGSFKLSSFLDTFQDVYLTGILTPHQFKFENFTAQTLTGSIEGSGKVDFSKRKKRPIDMSFKFNQMDFFLSKNTKTQGSGQIYLYGSQKPYSVKGSVYLNEGYSRGKFEVGDRFPITEVAQKQTPWWGLNLLIYLNNPFLIENELIFASVQGTLHILGSSQTPLVSGNLTMAPGGVFRLKDYDFKIESGQISYNKSTFNNPALDITGITNFEEVQYIEDRETAQNYKITAHVQGRMGSMNLKLSSTPSLSENNILSMMALGAKSVGFLGDTQLSNAVQYSYAQIASALFQDTMGRKLENIFGLHLSIIPYANKNKSTTKIRARKRWSENFSASASTSIDQIDRSLRFEYNLTPNFSLLGTWKENKDKAVKKEYNFEIEYKIDF